MGSIPTLEGSADAAGADPRLDAAPDRDPAGLRLPSALPDACSPAAASSGPS